MGKCFFTDFSVQRFFRIEAPTTVTTDSRIYPQSYEVSDTSLGKTQVFYETQNNHTLASLFKIPQVLDILIATLINNLTF